MKLGQNVGLLVGAAFWGVASDVWGRRYAPSASDRVSSTHIDGRWAFNITLLVTGVFATAAGASPGYVALCSLAAVWSIGVGGNLPVDSAVFLGKSCRSVDMAQCAYGRVQSSCLRHISIC